MTRLQRGFTLVELIVVMVVMGILAGILVVFFTPALNNYFATSRRASLSDVADGAMRKMSRDIRSSVPNSVRSWGNTCLETVPTSGGGRYRTAPDTVWDSTHAGAAVTQPVQPGFSFSSFDAVTDVNAVRGDWLVIGNQNTSDVYAGVNRGLIDTVTASAFPQLGRSRVTLQANMQAPAGYDGARFVIVPRAQGPVSFVCQNPGIDAITGTGTGTLFRVSNYNFAEPGSCPVTGANTPVLATRVSACSFNYEPNPGATQESGYVEVDLTLTDSNEFVRLRFGVHVDNVP